MEDLTLRVERLEAKGGNIDDLKQSFKAMIDRHKNHIIRTIQQYSAEADRKLSLLKSMGVVVVEPKEYNDDDLEKILHDIHGRYIERVESE